MGGGNSIGSKEHAIVEVGSPPRKDLSGKVYGLITLTKFLGRNYKRHALYLCKDIFGAESIISPINYHKCKDTYLQVPESKKKRRKIYQSYAGMFARCYNPTAYSYRWYGAQGVKVCDEWLGEKGFFNFLSWAATAGYELGLTIDKRDKLYSPYTCRWLTLRDNVRDRRNILLNKEIVLIIKQDALTYGHIGKDFYAKWAKEYECSPSTIRALIKGESWADIKLEQEIQ